MVQWSSWQAFGPWLCRSMRIHGVGSTDEPKAVHGVGSTDEPKAVHGVGSTDGMEMVHGGPYPAATDSRFTAVGVDAAKRWIRPISFQNWPNHLLPLALQNNNPLGIWRNINGQLTKDEVA